MLSNNDKTRKIPYFFIDEYTPPLPKEIIDKLRDFANQSVKNSSNTSSSSEKPEHN